MAYLHYWLGRSQVDLGNLDVVRSHAVEHYLRAIAALTGSHDTEVEAWSHYHLARAYSHLRDFPNAVRAFRRAITLNRVGGNRRWEAIILADLATTLTHAGHPAIARSAWQTALAT